MPSELFVYWRVPGEQAPAAIAAARTLQAALCLQHAGLNARLYQRSDDRRIGSVTVMETYARRGGLDPSLRASILEQGQQALMAWCAGADRHVEVFELVE